MSDDSQAPRPTRRPRADGAGGAPIGRTLPHSVEAEEYLLSCCFLDGLDVVSRCLEARISANSFHVPAHRTVFEKLVDLYNRQSPIDLAVIAEELKTARTLDADGVAWNVLLPACDGDVATLDGIQPLDRMIMRSAELKALPKSSIEVFGANP